jgi:hypothetical protein
MLIRWLTVFLDFPADSFDAGVAFWRAVTGYGLSPFRGEAGEFATLLPPSGDAYLRVQRLVEWDGEATLPPPVAGENGGSSRVDTVSVDVPSDGFERECAFWAALTGWEAHEAPHPGFVVLRSPAGMPVRIILQRLASSVPGQRAGAHLDFGCTDRGALGRHVALGARVTATLDHWTVLADPAGRAYCLVGRDPIGAHITRLTGVSPSLG